ncbi:MAG: hypothetical protein V1934_03930 [Methanobacteriota archaeon]
MTRDFTLQTYVRLLEATKKYSIVTVSDFLSGKAVEPFIVLRHDVDKFPARAARMAKLENRLGVHATYYFRWDPKLLHVDRGYPSGKEPGGFPASYVLEAKLYGHEVGYHYENLSDFKGDKEKALPDFVEKLAALRKIAPVTTAAMHGAPRSRVRNADMLLGANFKALGLLGEPYISKEFSDLVYVTDSGRRWNSGESSVRDRLGKPAEERVKSTDALMELVKAVKYPRLMVSAHPQRWGVGKVEWIVELVGQNVKNVGKMVLRG